MLNKPSFDINKYFFIDDVPGDMLSHSIDAFAYAMANSEAIFVNKYMKLYIRKKPWYLPTFIYEFILKKILILANFSKITK